MLAPQLILTQCPSSSASAGDAARSRGARRGVSLFSRRTHRSFSRQARYLGTDRGSRPRHAADRALACTLPTFGSLPVCISSNSARASARAAPATRCTPGPRGEPVRCCLLLQKAGREKGATPSRTAFATRCRFVGQRQGQTKAQAQKQRRRRHRHCRPSTQGVYPAGDSRQKTVTSTNVVVKTSATTGDVTQLLGT